MFVRWFVGSPITLLEQVLHPFELTQIISSSTLVRWFVRVVGLPVTLLEQVLHPFVELSVSPYLYPSRAESHKIFFLCVLVFIHHCRYPIAG